MAVIINDFEIVPEPPPPAADLPGDQVTPEDIRLKPEEVIAIQERERVRAERVRAD